MRKDVLAVQLNKVIKNLGWFQKCDQQTLLLYSFLNTEAIVQLSDYENISFTDDFTPFVAKYLQKNPKLGDLFSQNYLRSRTASSVLFNQFIAADKKPHPEHKLERKQDQDTRINYTMPFLDAISLSNVCQTSYSCYLEFIKAPYWKDRFIDRGLDKAVINGAVKTQAIKNYKILFFCFDNLSYIQRSRLSQSQFMHLSDDRVTAKYLKETNAASFKQAFPGVELADCVSIAGVKKSILRRLPFNYYNNFAKEAAENERRYYNGNHKYEHGDTFFHISIALGVFPLSSEEKRIVEDMKSVNLINDYGQTVLHLACSASQFPCYPQPVSTFVQFIKLLLAQGLDPRTKDKLNRDSFWYAKQGQYTQEVVRVLETAVKTLDEKSLNQPTETMSMQQFFK